MLRRDLQQPARNPCHSRAACAGNLLFRLAARRSLLIARGAPLSRKDGFFLLCDFSIPLPALRMLRRDFSSPANRVIPGPPVPGICCFGWRLSSLSWGSVRRSTRIYLSPYRRSTNCDPPACSPPGSKRSQLPIGRNMDMIVNTLRLGIAEVLPRHVLCCKHMAKEPGPVIVPRFR